MGARQAGSAVAPASLYYLPSFLGCNEILHHWPKLEPHTFLKSTAQWQCDLEQLTSPLFANLFINLLKIDCMVFHMLSSMFCMFYNFCWFAIVLPMEQSQVFNDHLVVKVINYPYDQISILNELTRKKYIICENTIENVRNMLYALFVQREKLKLLEWPNYKICMFR